jgi:putative membrane protein
MNTLAPDKKPLYKKIIVAVSVLIPLVVGALFRIRIPGNLDFLPPLYASFNAITSVCLVGALLAIKKNEVVLHRQLVRFALLLSILFLGCYVAYHLTSDPTYYGDFNKDGMLSESERLAAGSFRWIYFVLLVSHILLSMAVIPLVLFAYLEAWSGNFERHKKLVKYAFPIWLYVAVTGVVVYWMIAPFYA